MRVAGVMSGTSLDGIDVVVADIRGAGRFEILGVSHAPYPRAVRQRILAVSNAGAHTAEISRLNFLLGGLYADQVIACCKASKIPLESLHLIGCHGQTIYHEGSGPLPNTLQIGEAAVIAERTGVDVISNFRERDVAAGGQGAPLVPLVDWMLYRHPRRGRIALNVGGIANITTVPAASRPDSIVAFDTGPANMIIDQLMERSTDGRKTYDRDGATGRRGRCDEALLRRLLADPYFKRKPPKSAGREQYGVEFVDALLTTGAKVEDLIATATHFTAESVAMGIRMVRGEYRDLIVGGGGARNGFLMDLLRQTTGLLVSTTADHGVGVESKEALAFAVLAWLSERRKPGNAPSATGAKRPVVLGKLTRS